jgi:hypothetical protein
MKSKEPNMKTDRPTPLTITLELLQTLPIGKRNRGSDLKKRKITECAILWVPGSVILNFYHGFGWSFERIAAFHGGTEITVRKRYHEKVREFSKLLRKGGWIRRCKGKWIFDPNRTVVARREARNDPCQSVGAWLPDDATRKYPGLILRG